METEQHLQDEVEVWTYENKVLLKQTELQKSYWGPHKDTKRHGRS